MIKIFSHTACCIRTLLLTALMAAGTPAAQAKRGVAIVVDVVSYDSAHAEIDRYCRALEQRQGYKTYVVVDRWQVPDSIRAVLMELHNRRHDAIVGAVLMGDIPVPMVRDAQHLTSAFKMDQQRDRRESSVPSDRFYDDFGLRFSSLGKDPDQPYYYYSLSPYGSQRVQPDIFSGRIRPTNADGMSRYAKLRAYLRKATKAKEEGEHLLSAFVFTGDGSISESKQAHIDEFRALLEHFPHLAAQPHAFGYLDYSDAQPATFALMDALMRPDLSLAVLHHHGDWDTQYLNMRKNDNLTLDDMRRYRFAPNARCVVFDACFNGSFHRDNCVANEYIFADGATVATLAGSVNIIQDKWYDRYLGLLADGTPIGYINQKTASLEMHVIGDPTFTFLPSPLPKGSADLLCRDMAEHGKRYDDHRLLQMLRTSPLATVRLQAFSLLPARPSALAEDAIITALADNYEMVQRFAVNALAKNGSPKLIPAFAQLLTTPNLSRRVAFSADQAIQFLDKELLAEEVDKALAQTAAYRCCPDSVAAAVRTQVEKMGDRWHDDIMALCNDSLDKKHALRQASYMRIYCPAHMLPTVAAYTMRCQDNDVRKALLDVMGWHNMAYTAPFCLEAARTIEADTSLPQDVRDEAHRTVLRIVDFDKPSSTL